MSAAEERRGLLIGAALTVVAYLCITIADVILKAIVAIAPVAQILFVRSIFSCAAILVAIPFFGGLARVRPQRWPGVLACGWLIMANLALFPICLQYLPLTTALILVYVSPIMVVLIAPFTLGERLGPRRALAVLAGFAGAFLVIDPDFGGIETAYLLALLVAVILAARDIVTRRIANSEHPIGVIAIAYGSTLLAAAAICLTREWTPMGARETALLGLGGVLITAGHVIGVYAFRYAMAPVVSTLKYSSIAWSVALSFLVWGIWPEARELLGAGLIVASGIAIVIIRDRRTPALSAPALSRDNPAARGEG